MTYIVVCIFLVQTNFCLHLNFNFSKKAFKSGLSWVSAEVIHVWQSSNFLLGSAWFNGHCWWAMEIFGKHFLNIGIFTLWISVLLNWGVGKGSVALVWELNGLVIYSPLLPLNLLHLRPLPTFFHHCPYGPICDL